MIPNTPVLIMGRLIAGTIVLKVHCPAHSVRGLGLSTYNTVGETMCMHTVVFEVVSPFLCLKLLVY